MWHWAVAVSCRKGNLPPPILKRSQRDRPELDYLGSIGDHYFLLERSRKELGHFSSTKMVGMG